MKLQAIVIIICAGLIYADDGNVTETERQNKPAQSTGSLASSLLSGKISVALFYTVD